MSDSSSSGSSAVQHRTPVEHRFLGLDKRTFPYALFVLGVFAVATLVIPRINGAIAWNDPVEAGDELALTSSLGFTPTAGWNLENGHRLGDDGTVVQSGEATLVGDGVTVDIVADSFDGTPAALIAQVAKVRRATDDVTFEVEGKAKTLTTASGEVGVVQPYGSVDGDGLMAAFVIDGTGLEVTVFGASPQMSAAAEDIHQMITSIRTIDGSDS